MEYVDRIIKSLEKAGATFKVASDAFWNVKEWYACISYDKLLDFQYETCFSSWACFRNHGVMINVDSFGTKATTEKIKEHFKLGDPKEYGEEKCTN